MSAVVFGGMLFGFLVGTIIHALRNLLKLKRCTSCRPRCPNQHQIQIAGIEGMLFVATIALVLWLLARLPT